MTGPTTEIIPIRNRKDWRNFVGLPYRLNKGVSNWVPPLLSSQKILLDPKKHPFYEHAEIEFFLAKRHGKAIGRVAAIVDRNHVAFHDEKVGHFGFFECENDYEIAEKLLGAAKSWIKDQGMKRLRGPVNPCQNEDCGFLIDAYDSPPLIMMPYNPPYYSDFVERFGMKKVMDLYAYTIDDSRQPPEKVIRVAESIRKKERLSVRPVEMKNFVEEAKKVWMIYNKAWSKNWGFVPMTKREFDYMAKHLKQVIDPSLALMAEIDGEPVGFSLSLPDVNQALIRTNGRLFPLGLFQILWHSKKIDRIRITIMGVIHQYQKRGIDAIFYLDTWKNAVEKGYTRGEMSWILENNDMMNRTAIMLGGRKYKTYRMYEMKL